VDVKLNSKQNIHERNGNFPMRQSSYNSRLRLLETALLGVFHGNEKSVMKAARTMRKDMEFWYPLLIEGIGHTLPEAGGISVQDLAFADSSKDAADLLTYASAKQLAPRLSLGVIELRDQPIERLTYRGALIGVEKIASLLVVAGYSIMESAHDYETLRASVANRAHIIMELSHPAKESSVAGAEQESERVSVTTHVLDIFPSFSEKELEPA
jgi:hypothetical protein